MAHDKDNASGLVTGILIAAEHQRRTEEADRAASQAAAERDVAERQVQEERARADKLARQARENHEEALDDLQDLRGQFLRLLGLPLSEIAARSASLNPAFKQNHEALMLDLAEWIVSQKAFKELAIRFGEKLGLSLEEVLEMGEEAKEEVLGDRNVADHRSNVSGDSRARERRQALRERIAANQQRNVNWYQARVDDGTIHDLLEAPPRHRAPMIKAWKRLAAQDLREAQFNLGVAYRYGWLIGSDTEKAQDLLHKALEQGDPKACYELYCLYADPANPGRDEQKAKLYLDLALAANDKRAVAVVETIKEEAARQETRRHEEAVARQWRDEEAGFLEQLSIIREGEYPQTLFDKIEGRGYKWQQSLKLLHTLSLYPVVSQIKNEGSWLRPQWTAYLTCEGRLKKGVTPLSGKSFKVWSDFHDKWLEKYCTDETPGTFHMGKYLVGTVLDKFSLEYSQWMGGDQPRMTIALTYVPKCPVEIKR